MNGNGLIKGIGLGMVAGIVITACVVPMDRRKIMRSGAGKTIRAIGHVMENIGG